MTTRLKPASAASSSEVTSTFLSNERDKHLIQNANNNDFSDEPLTKNESRASVLVFISLTAFVISSCAILYFSKVSDQSPYKWLATLPILCLVLLTTSFGIWFVLAFTGSPRTNAKQRECYRFAYSFTFTTFIILAFPYLELWKPDISGPIGLIRGCVVKNSDDQALDPIGPRSILCPSDSSKLNSYPWLLTIGGFAGTTICKKDNSDEEVNISKCNPTDANRYSRISNGLVVPFYVVFLAFIGGAVSLSRRIPEYQKRSEKDYVPASELVALSAMKPYEARESVVFQIMQLISAPFIAITAYWAISPSTVPAGISLAFISGFASETILLLIRGVVDGIRPQTTVLVGPKEDATNAEVATDDPSVNSTKLKPSITVRVAIQSDLTLDDKSMLLSVDGTPVLLSPEGFVELTLEVNRTYLLVATGNSNGEILRAEMTITPTTDDEGKPVSLKLNKL